MPVLVAIELGLFPALPYPLLSMKKIRYTLTLKRRIASIIYRLRPGLRHACANWPLQCNQFSINSVGVVDQSFSPELHQVATRHFLNQISVAREILITFIMQAPRFTRRPIGQSPIWFSVGGRPSWSPNIYVTHRAISVALTLHIECMYCKIDLSFYYDVTFRSDIFRVNEEALCWNFLRTF